MHIHIYVYMQCIYTSNVPKSICIMLAPAHIQWIVASSCMCMHKRPGAFMFNTQTSRRVYVSYANVQTRLCLIRKRPGAFMFDTQTFRRVYVWYTNVQARLCLIRKRSGAFMFNTQTFRRVYVWYTKVQARLCLIAFCCARNQGAGSDLAYMPAHPQMHVHAACMTDSQHVCKFPKCIYAQNHLTPRNIRTPSTYGAFLRIQNKSTYIYLHFNT